jgi:hypothetical protein
MMLRFAFFTEAGQRDRNARAQRRFQITATHSGQSGLDLKSHLFRDSRWTITPVQRDTHPTAPTRSRAAFGGKRLAYYLV